jgi:hypothetical protein
VVATAAEVPGILINTAGIDPPYPAPVYTEVRKIIADKKSIYIEIGKLNAMAMVMETPGSAPKNRPIAIPGITHSHVSREPVMRPNAAINADISNIFYL